MNTPHPLLLLFAALVLPADPTQSAPIANPDSYDVTEDQSIVVSGADGILANDIEDGTLTIEQLSDVSHGVLVLDPDGSFTYTPEPNFTGTDSFTYRTLGSAGPQLFTVDQSASTVAVNATVTVSGLGSASDSDNSSVTGTITANPTPDEAPFATLQITGLNLILADSFSLRFSFFLGLAGVNVDAPAGSFGIAMVTPGAAATVDGSGNFNQTGNVVAVNGILNVDATGLADGQVPEGPQVINLPAETIDVAGSITQSGTTLVLNSNINFGGVFDVGGNPVNLSINGNVRATSAVQEFGEPSNVTTVEIKVLPVNDAPVVRNETYFMTLGTQLVVPGTGTGGTDVLVPAGARWSYLDTGAFPGAAWTEAGFNDSLWPTGNAQLGYEEGDEATVIGFGPESGNKFISTWFRHTFTATNAGAQGELVLRLLRDDGAVVFLNGVEVVRSNLDPAAGPGDAAGVAVGGAAESFFYEYSLPASLLVEGENILAVEVHQASATSSDVSFDLELRRERYSGGVLGNDTDPESGTLTGSLHTPPGHGTVQMASDGSFVYTPQPGFTGTDCFTYEVFDASAEADQDLLPFGTDWKYLDDGSDQGTAWRASSFDDGAWAQGPAELGYGETDHATTVGFIDTTPGDPANVTKNATTYFRRSFWVGDPAALINPRLRLLRDDAAAIYLNGVEIYRDFNLVAGAGFDAFATAGVADENQIVTIGVSPAAFSAGENVLAVEVHQSGPTSSDISFDLAVMARVRGLAELVSRGAAWRYEDSGADLLTAWTTPGFDDSLWLSGPAVLGFGNGGEATVVAEGSVPRRITTYLRTVFNVENKSAVQSLALDLLRDDGAAVYLNGIEIARNNLAEGAAFDTLANQTVSVGDEGRLFQFPARNLDALQEGPNVLAVEVHQVSDSSSDLAFDLRLNGAVSGSYGKATIVVQPPLELDSDGDGMDDDWELFYGLVIGIDDSASDEDGDGESNGSEFVAKTNPRDPTSRLFLREVTGDGTGTYTVRFASVAGLTYRLQFSPDLLRWTDVPEALETAIGPEAIFEGSSAPTGAIGYFRVVVD